MTTLGTAPSARAGMPPAYAAVMKAKLRRDRESYAAFRQVDQAEHDRAHQVRTAAALKTAQDEVRLWGEDVEAAEPEAAAGLSAFRAAEDRHRDAVEYARQQLAAYGLVKGKGTPAEETSARIVADTAEETTSLAAEVLEEKRTALAGADRALAEAREGLAAAERQLQAARRAAARPAGQAPISDVTVSANAAFMQQDEIWDSLSRPDKGRVQHLAEPRNLMSDREWQAMMREVLTAAGGMA